MSISTSTTKNFWIIYLLSFIGDFTNSALSVGIVVYATALGVSTVDVGWIGSAYGLTYLVTPAIIGKLGEKMTRKTNLLIGTFTEFLLAAGFLFFVQSTILIILGFALYGIVYAFFWPPIEAYISERFQGSAKAHSKGFSNFCIAWGSGLMIGPYIGPFFADIDIKIVIYLVMIIYFIGFLAVLFGLDHKPNGNFITDSVNPEINFKETSAHEEKSQNIGMKPQYLSIILLLIVTTNTILINTFKSYFPNFAKNSAGLNWSGELIGQVVLCFGIGRVIYFILSRLTVNTFSAFLQNFPVITILIFLMVFIRNPVILGIIFAISGMLVARNYLTALNLLMQLESKAKGAKAGLFESFVGLGSALAPVFAGWIAELNLVGPFYAFACLGGILSIALILIRKKMNLNKF